MNDSLSTVADFAEKALFYEVSLTPKPGLVDRFSNGAHQDMDFFSFVDSIISLRPFFSDYLKAGFQHNGSFSELFQKLRLIGIDAEKAMMKATKGINTHKGANFSFALLLGATGFYMQKKTIFPFTSEDTNEILKIVAAIAEIVQEDFTDLAAKTDLSYGEKLYLEKGLMGIRGEAIAGYPILKNQLLPFFRNQKDEHTEIKLLRALVFLMSFVEDGNLLHRGGLTAWQQVKDESLTLHQADLTPDELILSLKKYDQQMIDRNLSPGGSADLIALGIYLAFLEDLF
ncbi:triphosphoribosyl-dephospho-CoA synthase CitG [Enterococcus sp. HY326]|uniref:triphosphoribosyl-dephospho-CoA synthase CitG n=1 Tax=Enterococcus sp. HY326 TaxID=2971265 RepID=UPI00223EE48C|nr:triphosphoribosyl-dephospho-CoA synthase CitG [Enterococcus sp. HY326]